MGRPKLVIFEGGDGTGKTTLFQGIRRLTNYQPLCIERFTGSNWVYDQVRWGRGKDLSRYFQQEKELREIYDVYLILLEVNNTEVLKERIAKKHKGEDLGVAQALAINTREIFAEYAEKTKFSLVSLDTHNFGIEKCLGIILNFIGEVADHDDIRSVAKEVSND